MILVVAFLLGCVCGLRTMTGPALVCWAVHLGWLGHNGSQLGFLNTTLCLVLFSLMAVGELVADKLPFVPSRTTPGPLAARCLFGALCGACLAIASGVTWPVRSVAGVIGAVFAAFAGYHLRRWLTVEMGLPDLPVALAEDVVAVGGGLLLVSGVFSRVL